MLEKNLLNNIGSTGIGPYHTTLSKFADSNVSTTDLLLTSIYDLYFVQKALGIRLCVDDIGVQIESIDGADQIHVPVTSSLVSASEEISRKIKSIINNSSMDNETDEFMTKAQLADVLHSSASDILYQDDNSGTFFFIKNNLLFFI